MTNGMNKLRNELAEARRVTKDDSINYEVFDGGVRLMRAGRPITGRLTLDEARRMARRFAA